METTPSLAAPPLTRSLQAVDRDQSCKIALDTEFLALHEQLDAALESDWLWRDGRVAHIHLKDYDGRMFDVAGRRIYLHPGEGAIDFNRFFAGLRAREYNGTVSLESPVIAPDGTVDIPRLRRSLALVRKLISEDQ